MFTLYRSADCAEGMELKLGESPDAVTATSDSSGKVVNYSYDSSGNATAAATTVGGVTITSPVNAYSGAYLSSVTDPFGNLTSYSYTQSKGTLNSLTNAKSVTTNYSYNAYNDLLTAVQTGKSLIHRSSRS